MYITPRFLLKLYILIFFSHIFSLENKFYFIILTYGDISNWILLDCNDNTGIVIQLATLVHYIIDIPTSPRVILLVPHSSNTTNHVT